MAVRALALIAVTCLAASACGAGGYGSTSPTPTTPNTPPVADQVNATASLAFDPSTLNTTVGHTVTFKFGSVGHNIYFDAATGAPADIPGVIRIRQSREHSTPPARIRIAATFIRTCKAKWS